MSKSFLSGVLDWFDGQEEAPSNASPDPSSAQSGQPGGAIPDVPGIEQKRAILQEAGARYGVDPLLLEAMMYAETSGNPKTVGPEVPGQGRAAGAFQIMPGTQKELGITEEDAFDFAKAADAAARYVKQYIVPKVGEDPRNVALAYHAGPSAAPAYLNTLAYEQPSEEQERLARRYVGPKSLTHADKVKGFYDTLAGDRPPTGPLSSSTSTASASPPTMQAQDDSGLYAPVESSTSYLTGPLAQGGRGTAVTAQPPAENIEQSAAAKDREAEMAAQQSEAKGKQLNNLSFFDYLNQGNWEAYNVALHAARALGIKTDEEIEQFKKDHPQLPDPQTIMQFLGQGAGTAATSLMVGAPGALAGSLIGGPVGGFLGHALSAGLIFSLSEYDQFLDRYAEGLVKAGEAPDMKTARDIAKRTVNTQALVSGAAEGTFEALGEMVTGRLWGILGKGAAEPLRKAIGEPVTQWMTRLLRRLGGNMFKSAVAEVPTEELTSLVQEAMKRSANMGSTPLGKLMADTFLQVAAAVPFFGAVGTLAQTIKKGDSSILNLTQADEATAEEIAAYDKVKAEQAASRQQSAIDPETGATITQPQTQRDYLTVDSPRKRAVFDEENAPTGAVEPDGTIAFGEQDEFTPVANPKQRVMPDRLASGEEINLLGPETTETPAEAARPTGPLASSDARRQGPPMVADHTPIAPETTPEEPGWKPWSPEQGQFKPEQLSEQTLDDAFGLERSSRGGFGMPGGEPLTLRQAHRMGWMLKDAFEGGVNVTLDQVGPDQYYLGFPDLPVATEAPSQPVESTVRAPENNLPKTPETPSRKQESASQGLDEGQVQFIEKKIRELGSVGAVDALYKDDSPVAEYARRRAREIDAEGGFNVQEEASKTEEAVAAGTGTPGEEQGQGTGEEGQKVEPWSQFDTVDQAESIARQLRELISSQEEGGRPVPKAWRENLKSAEDYIAANSKKAEGRPEKTEPEVAPGSTNATEEGVGQAPDTQEPTEPKGEGETVTIRSDEGGGEYEEDFAPDEVADINIPPSDEVAEGVEGEVPPSTDEAAASREDRWNGFVRSKSPMEKGRAKKALEKELRFQDTGEVSSIRDRIDSLFEEGRLETSSLEEPKLKWNRATFNRLDSYKAQHEYEQRIKDAGTKTVYLVNGSDLGKTGYDYANHLLGGGGSPLKPEDSARNSDEGQKKPSEPATVAPPPPGAEESSEEPPKEPEIVTRRVRTKNDRPFRNEKSAALHKEVRKAIKDPDQAVTFEEVVDGDTGEVLGVEAVITGPAGEAETGEQGAKKPPTITPPPPDTEPEEAATADEATGKVKQVPPWEQRRRERAEQDEEIERATAPSSIVVREDGTIDRDTIPTDSRIVRMKTEDLNVDPDRFQFKRDVNSRTGAGSKLSDVQEYDPELGGVLSVWFDPEDGKAYVVNGHHRYDLAKRAGVPDVDVRFLQAETWQDAKLKGAAINIAEGNGRPEDVAHFMREKGITPKELMEKFKVSLKGDLARKGAALSQLHPSIFGQVESGELDQGLGVVLGEGLEDQRAQLEVMKAVDKERSKGRKISPAFLRELINEVKGIPTTRGTQASLFGEEDFFGTRPVLMDRAALREYAVGRFVDDKRLFSAVANAGKAERLSEVGNTIKVADNRSAAERAAFMKDAFDKLAGFQGGPISELLNEYALRLSKAGSPREADGIKREFYEAVAERIPEAVAGRTPGARQGAGTDGEGGEPGSGRGRDRGAETQTSEKKDERTVRAGDRAGKQKDEVGKKKSESGKKKSAARKKKDGSGDKKQSDRESSEKTTDTEASKEKPAKDAGKFSLSEKPAEKKNSVEAVTEAVRSATDNAQLPADVAIVQSESDLPEAVRKIIQARGYEGRVEGVYHDGKVYLVADNLSSPERAQRVYLEEMVGHFGLRAVLGEDLTPILNAAWLNSRVARSARGIADNYGLDLKDREQKLQAIEEAVAKLARDPEFKASFLDRLIAAVRKALRRLFPGLKLSDAEIRDLISKARQAVGRGGAGMSFSAKGPVLYSHMQRVLEKKLPHKGTGKGFAEMVQGFARKGEFKQEELDWSGMVEWLEARNERQVTKDDVIGFVRAATPNILDIWKGERPFSDSDGLHAKATSVYNAITGFFKTLTSESDDALTTLLLDIDVANSEAESTKDPYFFTPEEVRVSAKNAVAYLMEHQDKIFSELLANNGSHHIFYDVENIDVRVLYDEVVLSLYPDFFVDELSNDVFAYKAQNHMYTQYGQYVLGGPLSLYNEHVFSFDIDEELFYSNHFSGDKNPILHTRTSVRDSSSGDGRLLFIEEIQSDWHQKGRKKGYDPTKRGSVADAPWKQSWPLLGFKFMLRKAAEQNMDGVAWTTGKQQSNRYKLTDYITSVSYDRAHNELTAFDQDDNYLFTQRKVSQADLADYIGQNAANDLLSRPDNDDGYVFYALNDTVEHASQGMVAFYDKILTSLVNKYVKKWGVKVGTTKIDTGEQDIQAVHFVPINDKMRDSVLEAGQPMFSLRSKSPDLSGLYAGLPEDVKKRLDVSSKGIPIASLAQKLRASVAWTKNQFTRAHEHLDPDTFGAELNILRLFQETSENSRRKAQEQLADIVRPMKTMQEKRLFELHLVMDDMIRDMDSGLLKPDQDGKLPFGFDEQTARDYATHIRRQALENEGVSTAIKVRHDFMRALKRSLVEEDLLDKSVLDDDRYFHHQVLEYRAARALGESYNLAPGTGSRDLRMHRKGWQIARKGSVKDYSTDYFQSEFEVIAQGLAQVETKKAMDRMKQVADVRPALEARAKAANDAMFAEKWADLEKKDMKAFAELDARMKGGGVRMGRALHRLAKMASDGELAGLPNQFNKIVAKLASEHARVQQAQKNKATGSELRIDVTGMNLFELLSHLVQTGHAAKGAAFGFYKGRNQRLVVINDVLGSDRSEWDDFLPPGFTAWQPKPGGVFFRVNSITDSVLERVRAGEPLPDKIPQVWARVPGQAWAVPVDLAKTLDNLNPPLDDHVLSKASAKVQSGWKIWTLVNPFRWIRYNLNNLSGDADIVMAYDPKIFKYAWKAAKDLKAYRNRAALPKGLQEQMDEAMRLGVTSSGWSVQELNEVASSLAENDFLEVLRGERPNLFKRFWKSSKDFTTFRENILRLAAFRYFQDQIKKGRKPGENMIAASNRDELLSMKDSATDAEMAAKLSRELIGDYGNISEAGKWIRRHLISFYSWMEINAPRYVRLLRNLQYEGKSKAGVGAVLGWKATKLGVKASALYAAVVLFNMTFFPDEWDEIGEDKRRQLHLILGRREDGTIMSIRFQGALSDALGWFGAEDVVEDVKDVVSGRETIVTKAGEGLAAGPLRLFQGTRPIEKAIYETITGKALWPDPTAPRPIRDKAEHIARLFSLGTPYVWASRGLSEFTDLPPKPMRKEETVLGQLFSDIFAFGGYSSDPGETAYYDVKKKMFDFLEDQGREMPSITPTKKGNALYQYKRALRYGDVKAAKRYLQKYFELGGSAKGLKISVKLAHPLGGMSKNMRRRFLGTLSAKDREVYRKALEWYMRLYGRDAMQAVFARDDEEREKAS